MTPTAELLAPRAPGYVEPTPRGRLPFERTAERLRSTACRAPRATRLGDWPRTTRVLPWMLAAMMAVVWLVPFNTIQLTASLPIDLKFDRLVLPVIFVAVGPDGRHRRAAGPAPALDVDPHGARRWSWPPPA